MSETASAAEPVLADAVRRWRAPDLPAPAAGRGLGTLLRREPHGEDDGLRHEEGDPRAGGASAELLQASYDEGFAAGLASAQAAAAAEASERVDTLIRGLERLGDVALPPLEAEVVELARAMSRLVLGREWREDADFIRRVVHLALDRLPSRHAPALLRLHPDDAALLAPLLAQEGSPEIRGDADLARGECRLESGARRVDAGIDALVASIVAGLEAAPVDAREPTSDLEDERGDDFAATGS